MFSSRGGSGDKCPRLVPGSGAGGGRGPLERAKATVSAVGDPRRGICLLPHLLLHLQEKQKRVQ